MKNTLLLITDMVDYGDYDAEFDRVVDRIGELIQVFRSHQCHVACIGVEHEKQLVRPLHRYQVASFKTVGFSLFFSPEFPNFLKAHEIDSVYVCGSDVYCYTLKALLDLSDWTLPGHRNIHSLALIKDACYQVTMESGVSEAALKVLSAHDIDIKTTDKVISNF